MSKPQSTHIRFIDHHMPSVKTGVYSARFTQELEVAGEDSPLLSGNTLTQRIVVEGPRYTLDPALVRSTFPADNASGAYDNVLPHIILGRSTLPWERALNHDRAGEGCSWLALFVFDETEIAAPAGGAPGGKVRPRTVTVADLPEKLRQELGPAQDPSAPVSTIDVPADLLERAMPRSLDTLRVLSHVRNPSDGKGLPLSEVAEEELYPILIAPRLPTPDKRSTVYLVALDGHGGLFGDDGALKVGDGTAETFVVLHSWSFLSRGESGLFSQIVQPLLGDVSLLRLGSPGTAPDPIADEILGNGYIPLPHQTRSGNRMTSFYRGPYVPALTGEMTLRRALLARSADQLLEVDPAVGMLNVSYAAAWELGRMLCLQSTHVAQDIVAWKKRYRERRRYEDAKAHPRFAGHLPHQPPALDTALPDRVARWVRQLARLEHVPFNYLLAHEGLVPLESIRLATIDDGWCSALIGGALTIGHVPGGDADIDAQAEAIATALKTGGLPANSVLCIRSRLIAEIAHLDIEAFGQPADAGEDGPPIALHRQDHPAPDLLLFHTTAPIDKLTLAPAPQALHFGLEHDANTGKFFKTAEEYKLPKVRDDRFEPDMGANRNVDLHAIATHFLGEGPNAAAHKVAMLMIEGTPKIELTLNRGAP